MILFAIACAFQPGPPPPGDEGDADTAGSDGETGIEDTAPPTVADAVARLDLDGAYALDAFVRGDGAADILLSDGRIVTWDGGALTVGRTLDATSGYRDLRRIPDLDGDGSAELLTDAWSDTYASLTLYRGDESVVDESADALWSQGFGVYWQTDSTLDWEMVGDVSGDGLPDLEVVHTNQGVGTRYRLSADDWTLIPIGATESEDVDLFGVGDVDGDGVDDRALLSEAGLQLVSADDTTLATLVASDGADWSEESGSYATGGDFDGDGHRDVVARRFDGTVRVLSGPFSDTTVEASTVALLGEAWDAYPPLLDIRVGDDEGDGHDDVLYAEGSRGNDGAGALMLFRGPLAGQLDYASSSVAWAGEPGDHLGEGAWWVDESEGVFATAGAGRLLVFTTDR